MNNSGLLPRSLENTHGLVLDKNYLILSILFKLFIKISKNQRIIKIAYILFHKYFSILFYLFNL